MHRTPRERAVRQAWVYRNLTPFNVINRVRRNNGTETPIRITRATADIDLAGSWIDLR